MRAPTVGRVWILLSIAVPLAAAPPDAKIRDAAAKAIALIQASQKGWYDHQNCVSCHHQFQPALAYRAAREHGIPLDETIARADAVRAFGYGDLDTLIQYNYVIEPAMTDAYQLVAADAAGVKPNLGTAMQARLIAARQAPDGHWDSFHQRPPSSYSRVTQTALAVRAIQLYSHASQHADVRARVALAKDWLLKNPAKNTEERTYQLLGLAWAGVDGLALKPKAQELLKSQQADGGWNSIDGRSSDAYSTAQALVALRDAANVPIIDAAWQRGIDWLLKTQAEDGSWHVVSRLHPPASVSPPYFESGYPYGHDQFLSAQGSSWAVMALARALGKARKYEAPKLGETGNPEPWVETVLFGSADDFKKLLDMGLDPNCATPNGTTLLMMVAPDSDKMRMVLDRGGKVNARAKSGYTALMVAANYRESTPAMKLLLDRGAEVTSEKPAMFRANPFFLAAYAGNTEILDRLKQAGANSEDPMILIGTSSATPLAGAVRFGNVEVARKLVELGADVSQVDGGGLNPVARAVLGNQVEMARFLIEKGADVNHADKAGMTPLLYAASIDFGDSAMIDLLVQSGARRDARTKEGLTALELAQKYKHTHLIPSLAK
jgi:ankyrin repeat protein